jgi:hypothetical protein
MSDAGSAETRRAGAARLSVADARLLMMRGRYRRPRMSYNMVLPSLDALRVGR